MDTRICYTLLAEGQLHMRNGLLYLSVVEELLTTKKQFTIWNNILSTHFFGLFTASHPHVQLAVRREEFVLCYSNQYLRWRLQTLTDW